RKRPRKLLVALCCATYTFGALCFNFQCCMLARKPPLGEASCHDMLRKMVSLWRKSQKFCEKNFCHTCRHSPGLTSQFSAMLRKVLREKITFYSEKYHIVTISAGNAEITGRMKHTRGLALLRLGEPLYSCSACGPLLRNC